MKVEIKIVKRVEITRIYIDSHINYCKSSIVNGTSDFKLPNIPKVEWDDTLKEFRWRPIINIDGGYIEGWPNVSVEINYDVCNDFKVSIADSSGNIVKKFKGYVPQFMSPEVENFGDCVNMKIDDYGNIFGWNSKLVKNFIENNIEYENV